jgi:hypothetical protein
MWYLTLWACKSGYVTIGIYDTYGDAFERMQALNDYPAEIATIVYRPVSQSIRMHGFNG